MCVAVMSVAHLNDRNYVRVPRMTSSMRCLFRWLDAPRAPPAWKIVSGVYQPHVAVGRKTRDFLEEMSQV